MIFIHGKDGAQSNESDEAHASRHPMTKSEFMNLFKNSDSDINFESFI